MKKHPILRVLVDSLISLAVASVFAELILTGVEDEETKLFVDRCVAYAGYTAMFTALAYVCFREARHSDKKGLLRTIACVMAAVALITACGFIGAFVGYA